MHELFFLLRMTCKHDMFYLYRIQANYIIWRVIDSLNNVLMEDDRKLKNILNAVSIHHNCML